MKLLNPVMEPQKGSQRSIPISTVDWVKYCKLMGWLHGPSFFLCIYIYNYDTYTLSEKSVTLNVQSDRFFLD